MIRRSRVVIVICPTLEDTVREIDPHARTVLIENAPGSADDEATPEQAAAVRRQFGVSPSTPLVLYTGTFEAYQGLDLLFAAMAIVGGSRPDARLLLAGGKPDQVARARDAARAAGADAAVIFAGERPGVRDSRRTCWPPTCSCRRGRAAPTRRSRSTSTCGRGNRSSPPVCSRTRRC